jgi:hypothetical protein
MSRNINNTASYKILGSYRTRYSSYGPSTIISFQRLSIPIDVAWYFFPVLDIHTANMEHSWLFE